MCNVEGPPLKKRKPQPLPPAEPYPIYLDYNATTPLGAEAWRAMCEVHEVWGNPSSSHPYGLAAKHALEAARQTMSSALRAPSPDCIAFTSGGTEANNLAIVGGALAVAGRHPSRHCVVSTTVEHPAVTEVLRHLSNLAVADASASKRPTADDNKRATGQLTFLRVAVDPKTGQLQPRQLKEALERLPGGPQSVALVSVMYANNELGSVNPIAELVRVTREVCGVGCLFHTDAAQALGKVAVDVQRCGVDLLSVAAHKFYGPKGVGALYIRPGVPVQPLLRGAGHERGLRPGTENVLLATGMAAALHHACEHLDKHAANMRATRDELARVLRAELSAHDMDFEVNGDLTVALPNTLNCALYKRQPDRKANLPRTYISGARLILTVGDQVCMSAGSACHSVAGDEEVTVSDPLKAIGAELPRAIGTLRLSTGRDTTMADVRRAARIIARHAAQQFAE